ncbi:hypothetical protein ACFRKB_19610 [Streptomyces scopuliridis]|uniref:hypothetical protein n=1 Tax=Streptomyces scopuliridis TaxID=452529 RepID=UPI0036AFAF2C
MVDDIASPGHEVPNGVPSLDPTLFEWSVRFSEIGTQWRTAEPYQSVSGEFFLTPLSQAVHTDPPNFNPSLYSEKEQRIGRELRIIDDSPFTGAGVFVAIRLQSNVHSPEMWISDHTQGLWKMDLDYSAYVKFLRLTKGAFGWQHLFTQAPLDDYEFQRTADRIARMLNTLPQVFPDYDYTTLLERGGERL